MKTIPYASPPQHRRQHRRHIVAASIAVIVAICLCNWTPRVVWQILYLYRQRQCMNYLFVPKVLIYDEHLNYTKAPPTCFASTFLSPDAICAFIHGRRANGCTERLVTIAVTFETNFPGVEPAIAGAAFTPAPATLGATVELAGSSGAISFPITADSAEGTLRVFAGQPDPMDDSHFTIPYELDGKSHIIDGWLMPDDTVKLQARIP